VIPNIVAGIVVGLGSADIGQWLLLVSPTAVLDGTNAFLFGVPLQSQFEGVVGAVDPVLYLAAAAIGIAGSVAITIRRFQRISA